MKGERPGLFLLFLFLSAAISHKGRVMCSVLWLIVGLSLEHLGMPLWTS